MSEVETKEQETVTAAEGNDAPQSAESAGSESSTAPGAVNQNPESSTDATETVAEDAETDGQPG